MPGYQNSETHYTATSSPTTGGFSFEFHRKPAILTLRRLMSYIYIYIYMEHPFLLFLDHTQRRSTVGRTPLDE